MAEPIKQQAQSTEQLTIEVLQKAGYKASQDFIKLLANQVTALVSTAINTITAKIKPADKPTQGKLKITDGIVKPVNAPVDKKEDKVSFFESLKTQFLQLFKEKPSSAPKERQLLSKGNPVILQGIAPEVYQELMVKFPELFASEKSGKKKKTKEDNKSLMQQYSEGGLLGLLPKGVLALLAGGALILGGLAALVAGLQTDGPFKGLLKIFSKVGLQGGIKLLEKGAKGFLNALESLIRAPISLLDNIGKGLLNVFGKGSIAGKILKPVAGLFAKMLSGLVKVVTPLLKRLPLIGTIISWGFAYTRFKSGDTVGGIIDVLSGIATIFPGVGTAISIGLDVLNAFLDYKTGGASPEASAKKAGMIGDFFGSIWNWIKEKAISVFSWFIDLGKLVGEGKWGDVLYKIAGWVPGLDWMLSWFGTSTEEMVKSGNTLGQQTTDVITSFVNWVKTNILDKITGFIDATWANLKYAASFIGIGDGGIPKPMKAQITLPDGRVVDSAGYDAWVAEQNQKKSVKMADGGVIPQVEVGEAGDEVITSLGDKSVVATKPTTLPINQLSNSAVIPLEKYFNGKDFSLGNNFLEKIANNTGDTNGVLDVFGKAMLKLAHALENTTGKQPINIVNGAQSQSGLQTASQMSDSNFDPIRYMRRQFSAKQIPIYG